jgi:hypothetical protein
MRTHSWRRNSSRSLNSPDNILDLSIITITIELGYNVMKGTKYFVSLQTGVFLTEEYTVMVHSKVLIGTRYLALQTRCRINRCYNRVRLCVL